VNVVFGYGSLAGEVGGRPCVLREHRCGWGVAMDNRRTIPGYKFYVDAQTGERPEVYVAFLCIWPAPGATVDGVAFEVDDAALAALDDRERNYDRCDVSGLVEPDLGTTVWAYLGSAAGRERCAAGRTAGTAVVSAEYLARVPGGDPPDLPVRRLLRRDVGA
jgi:gamma-glutamyl AIG2-like cyclotransferase